MKRLLPLVLLAAMLLGVVPAHAQIRGRSSSGNPLTIDVSRQGASPADANDDTQSIQASLDLVHAAGGGVVTITQPGTYYLTNLLTEAGGMPTAPNTTLNSALVIYSNTSLVCAPGVTIQLGITKDAARCYMLRNADPTGGNSNITIDGGFWNGGGIVAEATATSGTTFTIAGNYASRLTSGTSFYVSNVTGKTSYTCSIDSTYDGGTGLTTITVASGAASGGLQSSWQLSNAQAPAIAGVDEPNNLITITGDYSAFASTGSTVFIYANADLPSCKAYTVASVAYVNPTTTVTLTTDLPATINTTTKGRCAFIDNTTWYADLVRLQNITRLRVVNTFGGGCDKYVWHVVGCDQQHWENNGFETGSDGIHFGGLNTNLVVLNTYGRSLDNLIAVVSDEKWYRAAQTDIAGACSNILIDGIFLDAGKTCFEPVRATGTASYSIDGLTVRTLRGTVGSGHGVRLADDTASGYGFLTGAPMRGVVIEDNQLVVPTAYAQVAITGSGVKSVSVRDSRVSSAQNLAVLVSTPNSYAINAVTATTFRINATSATDLTTVFPVGTTFYVYGNATGGANTSYIVTAVSYSNPNTTITVASTNAATASGEVLLSSSPVIVDSLTIDGLTNLASAPSLGKLVQIDAIVNHFSGSNWKVYVDGDAPSSASGVILQVTNTTTVEGQIKFGSLSDCYVEGSPDDNGGSADDSAKFVSLSNTTLRSRVDLSNVTLHKTNDGTLIAYEASGPAECLSSGFKMINSGGGTVPYIHTLSSGALRLAGTIAADLDNDANYDDDTVYFRTAGTLAVRGAGINLALDSTSAAGLTASAGDEFFNVSTWSVTSARESAGIGLYRYNGTYWQYAGPPIVKVLTASTTLNAKHAGITITNEGAGADITMTLPAATVGQEFTFVQMTTTASGFNLILDGSGAETIALPSTGVQAATITSGTLGASVKIRCVKAGEWEVVAYTGTWT